MKIARMSIHYDTQVVAGSVVAQLGAIVCALQSEKSRRDGLFGASCATVMTRRDTVGTRCLSRSAPVGRIAP